VLTSLLPASPMLSLCVAACFYAALLVFSDGAQAAAQPLGSPFLQLLGEAVGLLGHRQDIPPSDDGSPQDSLERDLSGGWVYNAKTGRLYSGTTALGDGPSYREIFGGRPTHLFAFPTHPTISAPPTESEDERQLKQDILNLDAALRGLDAAIIDIADVTQAAHNKTPLKLGNLISALLPVVPDLSFQNKWVVIGCVASSFLLRFVVVSAVLVPFRTRF
jgi:hypothetical protein